MRGRMRKWADVEDGRRQEWRRGGVEWRKAGLIGERKGDVESRVGRSVAIEEGIAW